MTDNEKMSMEDMLNGCCCTLGNNNSENFWMAFINCGGVESSTRNLYISAIQLYNAIYGPERGHYCDGFGVWWFTHATNLRLSSDDDYVDGVYMYSIVENSVSYSSIVTLEVAVKICEVEKAIATQINDNERLKRIDDVQTKIRTVVEEYKSAVELSEKAHNLMEKFARGDKEDEKLRGEEIK